MVFVAFLHNFNDSLVRSQTKSPFYRVLDNFNGFLLSSCFYRSQALGITLNIFPILVPPSSSSRILTHDVFPSFRGEDVRKGILSHILVEFERACITPFIDNEIKRGESIGPELIRAIKESKIAVVLLSSNYASSKWCLDELVEIMKCREEFGQTVMTIFYEVDPSDVKKLTGDFGKVFRETCVGKTEEDIGRWRQALSVVATIAGYHSNNWVSEADLIKQIAIDISNKLNNSISSRDFDGLVGMRTHLVKMKPLLYLESDEVRMIGIWGPPGIGKTTIARVAFNQLSNNFQLSIFVDNIKAKDTSPCSDDYITKLQYHKQFASQITKHKDMEVSHLGVVRNMLKDKKVLIVLDGVDKSVQLDAMAKETSWFGPGSRIIITSQDHKLLRTHGVKHIYTVDLPGYYVARKIFCMYAFGQEYPKYGFRKLVKEVIELAGELPLGLRVLGSYFRGMSKQEWIKSMPRLKTSLNADIHSVLKFSYDALDDEDKNLFLHIACFFNVETIGRMEDCLATQFLEVRQRLNVLSEKSLISFENYWEDVVMENLLVKLGREIVRKQSIHERMFLIENEEVLDVLSGEATGSKKVIGIKVYYNKLGEFDISERAFEGMFNLQFLYIDALCGGVLKLPRGLNYLPRKLRVLHWSYLPLTYLPSTVSFEFLVELILEWSELEKLWEGIKPLRHLKIMDLKFSKNLRELPDLSMATNLVHLNLSGCNSLVELPTSIGNLHKLEVLDLDGCDNLSFLPDTINMESLCSFSKEYFMRLKSQLVNAEMGNKQSRPSLFFELATMAVLHPDMENLKRLLSFIEKALRSNSSWADDIGWLQLEPNKLPITDGTDMFNKILDDNSIRRGKHRLPKTVVYLLVPGLFSNRLPLYFLDTQKYLSELGLECYIMEIHSEVTITNSIFKTVTSVENNAGEIKDYIQKLYGRSKKKVVILGHGKGGLDAAAALSLFWSDLEDKVAGLVFAQSPYGGNPIASALLREFKSAKLVESFMSVIQGDIQAVKDLTYESRKQFLKTFSLPPELPTVSFYTEASYRLEDLTNLSQVVENFPGLPLGIPMAVGALGLQAIHSEKSDGVVTCRDAEVPGSMVVRPRRKLHHTWMVLSHVKEDPSEANPSQVIEALFALVLQKAKPPKHRNPKMVLMDLLSNHRT